VSGNSAQVGGAVQAEGTSGGGSSLMTTVISNSTLTRNSANTSGGVDMNSGDQEMVIDNSIIADNGTFDLQLNSPYVVTFSLVQRADPAVVLSTADGNILGVAPRLGPLADNGGSTRTHLPLADSPVVDAGDPAITGAPATDQRGSARIVRVIDLGAVEVPAALAATGRSTDPEPVLAALLLVLLGTAMITGTHLRRA